MESANEAFAGGRGIRLGAGMLFVVLAAGSAPAQTIKRVSLGGVGAQGNALSSDGLVSADSLYVVFSSDATNLVPDDVNGFRDAFVRDRLSGTTTLVSVSSGGAQGNALSSASDPCPISADGRYVVFYSSADNLVPGDSNLVRDVFLRDLQTSTTTRVSISSAGAQGNDLSSGPTISADGQYVAFYSSADNLVSGDTNLVRDCFVRDLEANTTTRISVSSSGVQGDGLSSGPIISADGRYVAFYSSADNLVSGDTNLIRDVFVRDRQTNTTTRVSVSSSGVQGDKLSSDPTISSDGRYVCFYSDATNLVGGDTNLVRDVFVRDRQTNTTTRASVGTGDVQGNARSETAAISGNGLFVAFDSDATNLVGGDTNLVRDTFLRDRQNLTTIRINASASGVQGNSNSADASLSASGDFVAFGSYASNLVAGDTNLTEDVFLYIQRPTPHAGQAPDPPRPGGTVPASLVVAPGPAREILFCLADPAGIPRPDALPFVILGTRPTADGKLDPWSTIGIFAGPPGTGTVRVDLPSESLQRDPLYALGFFLEPTRGAGARATPALVTEAD